MFQSGRSWWPAIQGQRSGCWGFKSPTIEKALSQGDQSLGTTINKWLGTWWKRSDCSVLKSTNEASKLVTGSPDQEKMDHQGSGFKSTKGTRGDSVSWWLESWGQRGDWSGFKSLETSNLLRLQISQYRLCFQTLVLTFQNYNYSSYWNKLIQRDTSVTIRLVEYSLF